MVSGLAASPSKKTQGANLLNGINWLVFVMTTGYFYNIFIDLLLR